MGLPLSRHGRPTHAEHASGMTAAIQGKATDRPKDQKQNGRDEPGHLRSSGADRSSQLERHVLAREERIDVVERFKAHLVARFDRR